MNWTQKQFKDFVTLQRGFDLPKSRMVDGVVPVLGSNRVIGYHNEVKVEAPGVVTGRSGTLGLVQYSEQPFWPHNTALWVKDFKGNNPKFVYYKLKTLHLERFNGGASVPTLNRNVLDTLPISVPKQAEQFRIVSILSAYDDLIENNRRRIALLEKASRLLYREWFVHFRFPGHEHVNITDGLPEGWESQYLRDVVTTQYGHTASASDIEVGPKFVRGTDINKRSFIDWQTVPYCPEQSLDFNKYALVPSDILVIRMADPGKVAIVEKSIQAVFASYLVRLKVRNPDKVPPIFLFMTLMDKRYQGFIGASSGGSTRKSASAKLLTDFYFALPPKALLKLYIEQITPMREMITRLVDQCASAARARDLLLPRLMNGAIII
ncbi:MAG: restriction endonuclease subunit S [Gammaproteobacteria bacterium]|nr:restriction endonuclease subunit S [Gammaproteobacteria bacterium]